MQVTMLADLTGNERLGDHVWGAKKDVLRSVLDQASPAAILNAWRVIRREGRDR